MSSHRVSELDELHRHLGAALQLEHATIPPYLVALYSIKPGTNSDAYHVLRAVVVEEMLHLTLAANILNAVGGNPDLTGHGFVPAYPAYLPDGETDFEVSLQAFSKDAVDTFLKIERPALAVGDGAQTIRREKTDGSLRAARVEDDSEEHFFSIGEFYQSLEQGLVDLHTAQGDELFSGDPARQITPEYYYSGGSAVIPVTDLPSAQAAIRVISEQGEGVGGGIFDFEDEIAHYRRFEQLLLGRYYLTGDAPGSPNGGQLDVDWDAVYPVVTNARLADYAESPDLHAAAVGFNAYYAGFLGLLTRAFQGEPRLLVEAVGAMFRIKELASQLIRQPLDGTSGLHAVPTFEMPAAKEDMS
jgi:hypothetical protein